MAKKTKNEQKHKKAISRRKKEQKAREEKELARFASDDDEDSKEEEEEEQPEPAKQKGPQSKKKAGTKHNNKNKKQKEESSSSEEESSDDDDDEKKPSEDEESSGSDDEEQDNNDKKSFFSDENAKWLKPKEKATSRLLDSDEDDASDVEDDKKADDNDDDASEDDGDDDDDDDLLEIEREAKLVDEEMEMEKAEAEEELRRTVREHTSVYHLPTQEELVSTSADRVVPPSELRQHVESILEVLADFKSRREPGRARKDYMEMLGHFLAELYGYLPELVEYFLTMFGPTETVEFMEASDKPRPMVIRTNTLKARRKDLAAALIKRGVSLDPLASWSKVGLKIIESPVPMGATPEYLGGFYMLQSAASMCPVLALSPQPQEKVMDMSAAPGGKTSYIAQLMKNTGVVMANDLKAARQKATIANMHRLGVKNVIACTHDGRKMGQIFKNRFDRVLLDAPCSGLGVISRDPSVKVQRTMEDIKQTAHLQKELLLAAIDSLKFKNTTGGVMVYSTCSISIAENEEVVQYALSKRDIKLVDTGLDMDLGTPGFTRYQQKRFHPTLSLTRRFYPHVHNMDGFFVAKIQKLSDKIPGQGEEQDGKEDAEVEVAEKAAEHKKPKKKPDTKKSPNKKRKESKKEEETPKPKKAKVSVPPTVSNPQKSKKKKARMNAKMTEPRRKKASADI